MSAALWIPLLWLWIIASKPIAYWLESGIAVPKVTDVTQGSFFDRNAYLVLFVVGIIVLAKRGVSLNWISSQNRWIWLFCIYCGISTIWSPIPFVAGKRWIKDIGNIVMILIILTERNPMLAMRVAFLRCAYLLVPLSVLFIKYYPDKGRYYNQWTWSTYYCGVTTNKNSLGLLAMVSGIFLMWRIVDWEKRKTVLLTIRKMWPEILVLLMCIWILKIADSQTSVSCFFMGSAVFVVCHLKWAKRNLGRLKWFIGGLLLVSFLFVAVPDLRKSVAESLGRKSDLTERTEIWSEALNLESNPIFGAGFSSIWLTDRGTALVEKMGGLAHSHNGYLETYLNIGIIGVFLLLAVLSVAARNSLRAVAGGAIEGNLFAALFVAGVIYNYTEVTFNNGNIVGFCLWLIAMRSPLLGRSNSDNANEGSPVRIDWLDKSRVS